MSSRKIKQLLDINQALIRHLSPSYFAMVMATGSVSVAAFYLGMVLLAKSLFYFNIGVYLILWTASMLRLKWYFEDMKTEPLNHARAPGFFTTVAATCVLGVQFAVLLDNYQVATVLWMLGIAKSLYVYTLIQFEPWLKLNA